MYEHEQPAPHVSEHGVSPHPHAFEQHVVIHSMAVALGDVQRDTSLMSCMEPGTLQRRS